MSAGRCTTRRYADAGADRRTTVCSEVYVAAAVADDDSAAYAFATGLGFASVHREDHLVLRLPRRRRASSRSCGRRSPAARPTTTW